MTDKMQPNPVKEALTPCPFCGSAPTFGLTKRTGCQLHGDPIQYVILGCRNPLCRAKPSVTGGDRYARGETGEHLKKGEEEAREMAVEYWNGTRALTQPAIPLLDPEMRADELRLHMGELTANEVRVARAAIRWANTRQPAIPEGMVLVPIEPTEVMLHEGASVGPDTNEGAFGIDFADIIYRAMLNAAPPTALEGEEFDMEEALNKAEWAKD